MKHTPDRPHNYCRRCERDFSSLRAFDAHFTGDIQFDWSPERENGFRCRDDDELLHAGMEVDQSGRWRYALSDERREQLSTLRRRASRA